MQNTCHQMQDRTEELNEVLNVQAKTKSSAKEDATKNQSSWRKDSRNPKIKPKPNQTSQQDEREVWSWATENRHEQN